jgi:hypothetical protein
MLFCAFDKLATTFIFFSAWNKSHVKWNNSQNLIQKMRTLLDQGFRCNKRCKCNFLVCMFAYHKHFQCTYIIYWVKILFEGSFGETVEMWDPCHLFWGVIVQIELPLNLTKKIQRKAMQSLMRSRELKLLPFYSMWGCIPRNCSC